jgi:protein arginine N-methyltransferase 1
VYDFPLYGEVIDDGPRMRPYVEALRLAVTPGSVVLDLGTGGTGFFAMLACRFGARRVFAIEVDDAIQVARETARDNGFANRIEFLQGRSSDIDLPERADVIISDLRGVLPLNQDAITTVVDARQRLLAPGGRLIPASDTLWIACVETPDLYDDHVKPWAATAYGFDLGAARDIVLNRVTRAVVRPEHVRLESRRWTTIDYATVKDPNARGRFEWVAGDDATLHGLCVWFDTDLGDGVGFSNRPGEPETVYGNAFLPLFRPGVLEQGDQVVVDLRADLVAGDYVWRWSTTATGSGGKTRWCHRQSTFQGLPLSADSLRRRAATYVPVLGPDAEMDRHVLEAMMGGRSIGEIAREVLTRFPGRFSRFEAALDHVGDLSVRYKS